jgi:hypothetical protein
VSKDSSFIEEQKLLADEMGILNEECWDDDLFYKIESLSLKDTFDFIFLLASCQSGVWFEFDGYPEEDAAHYLKVFLLLCARFGLIHERTQMDIDKFHSMHRDVLIDELVDYWNYGSKQEPVCPGKDTLRKFFFKCIMYGEWNFKRIENKYRFEFKEIIENSDNVYNFRDYQRSL